MTHLNCSTFFLIVNKYFRFVNYFVMFLFFKTSVKMGQKLFIHILIFVDKYLIFMELTMSSGLLKTKLVSFSNFSKFLQIANKSNGIRKNCARIFICWRREDCREGNCINFQNQLCSIQTWQGRVGNTLPSKIIPIQIFCTIFLSFFR